MADDDDAQETAGPGEILSPSGPRRASYTPPSNDEQSREAAASVFNDDAIAEAMAAELAKVASGPIPIITANSVPEPEPVGDPEPMSAPTSAPFSPPSLEPVAAVHDEAIEPDCPRPNQRRRPCRRPRRKQRMTKCRHTSELRLQRCPLPTRRRHPGTK